MDLRDTDDERSFRLAFRSWLEANHPGEPPDGNRAPFLQAWHRTLYAAGYAALSWPKAYGGAGAPRTHQLIFEEELGRARAPIPSNLGVSNVGPAIMEHGTTEQKDRYLPRILSGDEFWCQGYSEPDAGSDLASLRTTARLDGDQFVVTGQKIWTTWGAHADLCQLLVRTEPGIPGRRGISCLLVDMRSEGITVRPIRQISGDAEFGEVFFDEVRVPAKNLLGARGDGWRVAMSTLSSERAGVLTYHVRVRSQVEDLATLARQHGLDEDPHVRRALGRCVVDARALQLFSYWGVSNSEPMHGPIAKLLWSELVQRIHETAVMILGSKDPGWIDGLLDSRGLTIAAGTTEIQKNVIAERGLGMPR